MKGFSVFVILISCLSGLSAQTSFEKSFNDGAYTPSVISSCPEGGFLVSGIRSFETVVTKYDVALTEEWSCSFNSEGSSLYNVFACGASTDGGYYIAGEGITTLSGLQFCFLIKLNEGGNISWKKSYPYQGSAYHRHKAKQTASGEYVIMLSLLTHIEILKTDAAGNLIWGKSVTHDIFSGKNPGFDIVVNDDGTIVTSSKNGDYMFVIALDADGNEKWSGSFSDETFYTHANAICRAPNGDYLIAGYKSSEQRHGFVSRIDSAGKMLWTKLFSRDEYDNMSFEQIFVLDEQFIILGSDESDLLLLIVSSDGNVVSSRMISSASFEELPQADLGSDGKLCLLTYGNPFHAFFNLAPDLSNACSSEAITLVTSDLTDSIEILKGAYLENIGISQSIEIDYSVYSPGLSDYCSLTGLNDAEEKKQIHLFPSPASEYLTVRFPEAVTEEISVIILDETGRELNSPKINFERHKSFITLEIHDLPPGLYFLTLRKSNQESYTLKFIVIE